MVMVNKVEVESTLYIFTYRLMPSLHGRKGLDRAIESTLPGDVHGGAWTVVPSYYAHRPAGHSFTSLSSAPSQASHCPALCVSFIFRTVSHHTHSPCISDTPPESAQDPYTDALV
jgi:hypothetical protein